MDENLLAQAEEAQKQGDFLKAGRICAEWLQKTPEDEAALRLLEAISDPSLDNPLTDPTALEPLIRHFTHKGDYAKAAEKLESTLDRLEGASRLMGLRRTAQLASLCGQHEHAYTLLATALAEFNDPETLEGISRMARATDNDAVDPNDSSSGELAALALATVAPCLERALKAQAMRAANDLCLRYAASLPRAEEICNELEAVDPQIAQACLEEWLTAALQSHKDDQDQTLLCLHLARLRERQGQIDAALLLIRQALAQCNQSVEAKQEFKRILTKAERWEELGEFCSREAELAEDSVRADDWEEAARAFEKVRQPARAFAALARAFAETRDIDRFGADLERLAPGDAKVIELYRDALEATEAVTNPDEILRRLAILYLEQGDMLAAAQAQFELHERHPDDTDISEGFDALLEHCQDDTGGKLRNLLHQRLSDNLPIAQRRQLTDRLAEFYEKDQDFDVAFELRRNLLDYNGNDASAQDFEALESLCERHEKWAELAQILSQQAEACNDDAQKVNYLMRIGEIWHQRLQNANEAIPLYQEALALAPQDPRPLKALDQLYTSEERWDELIELLSVALESESDPQTQCELLRRCATLHHKLAHVEQELEIQREILTRNPGDRVAFEALAALYREQERFDDLADLYSAELPHHTGSYALQMRKELAQLYVGPLNTPPQALSLLSPVLDRLDAESLKLTADLARSLNEKAIAAQALELLAQKSANIEDRLAYRREAVQIWQSLDQLPNAQNSLLGLCMDDPTDLEPLHLLEQLFQLNDDGTDLAHQLAMRATETEDDNQRQALLVQASMLAVAQHNPSDAIVYCHEALNIAPTDLATWKRMADAMRDCAEPIDGAPADPVEAVPILEAALALEHDPTEAVCLAHRIDLCSERWPDQVPPTRAQEALARALEVEPYSVPTMVRLADRYCASGQLDAAAQLDEVLITHPLDERTGERLALRLASRRCAQAQWEGPTSDLEALDRNLLHQARIACEEALRFNPGSLNAYMQLLPIIECEEDWPAFTSALEQVAELSRNDPESCASYLAQAGDVYCQTLDQPEQASKLYQRAIDLSPRNVNFWQKWLAISRKLENWIDVATALEQLAHLETLPEASAHHWAELGELQRDHLDMPQKAIQSFDRALDAEPRALKIFKAQHALILEYGDNQEECQAYARMLDRAIRANLSQKTVTALANNLGELYRSTGQYAQAEAAYQKALNKNPSSIETLRMMARLQIQQDQLDKAIDQHRSILENDWQNEESWHSLHTLFKEIDQIDAAWCACQALRVLHNQNDVEENLYQSLFPQSFPQVNRALSNNEWSAINASSREPLLEGFYRAATPYALPYMAQPLKSFNLNKRRDTLEFDAQTPFGWMLNYIAQACNAAPVDCYKAPEQQTGISFLPLEKPALLVGEDCIDHPAPADLAFLLARQYYLMRTPNLLTQFGADFATRRDSLRKLVISFRKAVNPKEQLPDLYLVPQLVSAAEKMPEDEQQNLRGYLAEMIGDNVRYTSSRWLSSNELSANRQGLLLCTDLECAVRHAQRTDLQISESNPFERVRDLFLFSISQPYLDLRKKLHLSVDPS